MYPEAVSPVPTETGYNGQSLERASSIGEIPYDPHDANGFVSNGYNDTNMNGGSVTASPTPYATNGYDGNGYTDYNENGSVFSTNGNGTTCSEHGNENGRTQFVRRRLLPAIPKGEKHIFFWLFCFFSFLNVEGVVNFILYIEHIPHVQCAVYEMTLF